MTQWRFIRRGGIHKVVCPDATPSATKYLIRVDALPQSLLVLSSPVSVPRRITEPKGTPPPSKSSTSDKPQLTSVWPYKPGRVDPGCGVEGVAEYVPVPSKLLLEVFRGDAVGLLVTGVADVDV